MKKHKVLEDITLLIIYFTILGTGFFYCLSCYDKFLVPKQVLFQILTSLAIILWIFKLNIQKKIIIKSEIIYLLFLFVLFNFLSMIKAKNIFLSMEDIIIIVYLIMLFIILSDILENEIKKEGIINVISIVALITSVIAILQFLNIDITGVVKKKLVSANFLSTTFGYRNYLGEYLSLLFPLFLLLSFSSFYYFIVSLLSFIAIIIIQSRACYLSTIISCSFLFFLIYKYIGWDILKEYLKKFVLIIFIVILSLGLFTFIGKSNFTSEIKNRISESSKFTGTSLHERTLIWRVAAEMFKDSPFVGIGTGNFKLQYLTYYEKLNKNIKESVFNIPFPRQHPRNVHNEFLQIIAETGIFGMFSFLCCGIYIILYIFSILKKEVPFQNKILTIGIFCSIISLAITSFFGFPLHIIPTAVASTIIVSILINLRNEKKYITLKFDIKSRVTKFLLILILPVLTIYFIMPLFASFYFENGLKMQNSGKYKEAISLFTKAYNLDNNQGRILFYRGVAYRNTGEYQKSLEDFKQAQKTVDDIILRFNIARGYVFVNSLSEAEKEYKKLISLYLFKEYQAQAHYELALLYNKFADVEKDKHKKEKYRIKSKKEIEEFNKLIK